MTNIDTEIRNIWFKAINELAIIETVISAKEEAQEIPYIALLTQTISGHWDKKLPERVGIRMIEIATESVKRLGDNDLIKSFLREIIEKGNKK